MNIFGGPVVVQVTWWHTWGGYSNKWSQWRNNAPRVPGARAVATSIAYEAEVSQDMVVMTDISLTKTFKMNTKCLEVMETMPYVH